MSDHESLPLVAVVIIAMCLVIAAGLLVWVVIDMIHFWLVINPRLKKREAELDAQIESIRMKLTLIAEGREKEIVDDQPRSN